MSEKLGEFQRIAKYFKPLAAGFAGAFGLGDDAAAFEIPSTHELVATTDAMVEGVHFLRADGPQSIARRLLRSNLSDLAAMGADPHGYLLVTSLPNDIGEDWLETFARALGDDQKTYGGHLIGGDSVRTDGPITLSLTALGLVPKGQLMRRKTRQKVGSQPLSLYVTGTIGDAALGLMLSQGRKFAGLTAEEESYLKQRHFTPEPRLNISKAIRGFAKACIDISDGLVADIGHIAEQSSAQVILHAGDVPLSKCAQKLVKSNPDLWEVLLTGGEDYELAFAIEAQEESLLTIVGSKVNVPLTKIGTLQLGTAGDVQVLDQESRVIPLKQRGWVHF